MSTAVSALILAGAMFFALQVSSFKSDLINEMSSVASLIGANTQAALEFDDPKAAQQILSSLKEDKRIISAVLYNAKGKVFATFNNSSATALDFSFENYEGSSTLTSITRPIRLNERKIGAITLELDSMRGFYTKIYQFALIGLVVLITAGFGAYLISRRLQRVVSDPIVNLARTVQQVTQHKDYTLRVPIAGKDEIGDLIDRFNEMLEQIRQRDASLRESEYQLRLITDSLPVLISYVGADQRYRFINRAYEEWHNIPRENVIGKTIVEVVDRPSYQIMKPHIERALSGHFTRFEAHLKYLGVGFKYVSAVLVPAIDEESQKVLGFYALTTDISDRKIAEDGLKVLNEKLEQRVIERTDELLKSKEKLRHTERLASIGTLAAGMAHEIRNPINSISLAAQHALQYKKDSLGPLEKILETISGEAKRCGRIIKNILLFAKSEKTNKNLEDLTEIVHKAVMLAKSYTTSVKSEIILNLEPNLERILMNSTEIEQVMVNIINNAIEASTGHVKVEIKTWQSNYKVNLSISDNGPGIPEEDIGRIFDPFFSTKRNQGNTGLGLSLCHGIIVEHGGVMSVQSKPGVGTTFIVELPISLTAVVNEG